MACPGAVVVAGSGVGDDDRVSAVGAFAVLARLVLASYHVDGVSSGGGVDDGGNVGNGSCINGGVGNYVSDSVSGGNSNVATSAVSVAAKAVATAMVLWWQRRWRQQR